MPSSLKDHVLWAMNMGLGAQKDRLYMSEEREQRFSHLAVFSTLIVSEHMCDVSCLGVFLEKGVLGLLLPVASTATSVN